MAMVMFPSTLLPLPEEQQCHRDKLASKRKTSQAPRISKQKLVLFLSRGSGYKTRERTGSYLHKSTLRFLTNQGLT